MSVVDNYTVIIKVAPHCSIEIIFLYLQSLFSHFFMSFKVSFFTLQIQHDQPRYEVHFVSR